MENSTITMFESFYIAAQDMDIESRVKFYEAIMTYGFYGEEPELPGMVKTVFTAIKPVIDRSRQMRESGRRGGRPRKNEENGKNPPLNHPFDGKERKGKEKEMEKEMDKEKEKERVRRFAPPTVDEVRDYCTERGNNIDPQRFVDFYQSKGWKVGSVSMKDWKAAVRNWETRDAAPKKADNDAEVRQYYQQAKQLYPAETGRDEGWETFRKKSKGDPKIARQIANCIGEIADQYYSGAVGLHGLDKDIEVAYEYIRH